MNKVKQYIYGLTYKGRREKHIHQYNEDYQKYISMPENEFSMEYIEICSLYEHKKVLFTAVFITFITLIMTNVWKIIFDLLKNLINKQSISDSAYIRLVEFLSLFIIILTIIITIWTIYALSRNLYMLNKRKLFMEDLKVKRNKEHG